MREKVIPLQMVGWILGIVVLAIGILNLFLVHPVPGVVFLLLSALYAPYTDTLLKVRFGFSIPLVVKIFLGLAIIWFTLGVSDLGDMID
ncbi:hypothetical protein POKO110462_18685 [Pontibacter korlensis]|uniref:AI-2E family transporter n=1 Tax=Pontibacter korlensis TaxID=400092 RepID=A0A0E3ZGI4_9BACT|nr:hypothetical protein [Pontibacter korlensis]AKD05009.1 hypothetical protein PKOR_20410 [Pontibacter korlensis]